MWTLQRPWGSPHAVPLTPRVESWRLSGRLLCPRRSSKPSWPFEAATRRDAFGPRSAGLREDFLHAPLVILARGRMGSTGHAIFMHFYGANGEWTSGCGDSRRPANGGPEWLARAHCRIVNLIRSTRQRSWRRSVQVRLDHAAFPFGDSLSPMAPPLNAWPCRVSYTAIKEKQPRRQRRPHQSQMQAFTHHITMHDFAHGNVLLQARGRTRGANI